MADLTNDLDKFLKTDGLRILIESGLLEDSPEDDADPRGKPEDDG